MLEHITHVDFKILSLFTKDYARTFSIREITKLLNINYAHTFNRIKQLVKNKILIKKKQGQVNHISLNIQNLNTIQLISFVEEQESKKFNNTNLILLAKEASIIDPFASIGIFGSRVSGNAIKESDWDIFVITQEKKTKQMRKLMAKFPHITNIQLQVFSVEEFQDSLLSREETVVKHIVRNKQIIYNPHPFYNIISNWEAVKYAPSQTN